LEERKGWRGKRKREKGRKRDRKREGKVREKEGRGKGREKWKGKGGGFLLPPRSTDPAYGPGNGLAYSCSRPCGCCSERHE